MRCRLIVLPKDILMKFFAWLILHFCCVHLLLAGGKPSFDRRPAGTASYYFKSTEKHSRGEAGIEVFFRLETRGDHSEILIIDSVRQKEKDSPEFLTYKPVEECRKQWQVLGAEIGRVRVDTMTSLNANVPPCVPERILGSVTDILSFLFIQTKEEFRLNSLKKPGRSVSFDGFSVQWRRAPELLDADLNCAGGKTAYMKDSAAVAIFSWTPDPMNITMIRVMSPEGIKFIMAGEEKFELVIGIDKETGALLNGRSTIDELNLNVWMPVDDTAITAQTMKKIKGSGMPVTITRELLLKKL